MTPDYHTLCEQTRTFEDCGIRWHEDELVGVPCLQKALTVYKEMRVDPYAFQALIYFLSSLLPHSDPMYHHQHESRILYTWVIRAKDLGMLRYHIYRDEYTHKELLKLLNQLDPIEICMELEIIAASCVGGRSCSEKLSSYGFITVDRGYVWIIRCEYECDIPDLYKSWLQLTYEEQPHKIADLPSRQTDKGDFTFAKSLQTAADGIGLHDGIIPTTKFWTRQALTIVDVWDHSVQAEVDRQDLMPSYKWCVTLYYEMWNRCQEDLRDPFSTYSYENRRLLSKISYMRVFEECWQGGQVATQGLTGVDDFNFKRVQKEVYNHVLITVRDQWQPKSFGTSAALQQEFGNRIFYGSCNFLGE